jgi:hypothetical protein
VICLATQRAVSAVLALGVPDVTQPAVDREAGRILRAAITADLRDGATSSDIIDALRRTCSNDRSAYTSLLELLVLVIAEQRTTSPRPPRNGLPPKKMRRTPRRGR